MQARRGRLFLPQPAYCNVTNTWMTPVPFGNGSSAFPTTAPSMRLRSVPFIAWPRVDDVTRRSPAEIGPFSAVTLHETLPPKHKPASLWFLVIGVNVQWVLGPTSPAALIRHVA